MQCVDGFSTSTGRWKGKVPQNEVTRTKKTVSKLVGSWEPLGAYQGTNQKCRSLAFHSVNIEIFCAVNFVAIDVYQNMGLESTKAMASILFSTRSLAV